MKNEQEQARQRAEFLHQQAIADERLRQLEREKEENVLQQKIESE